MEERGEELGEEDGVFGWKLVAELAQRIELRRNVDGELRIVHETGEIFARSRCHGLGFSDHG